MNLKKLGFKLKIAVGFGSLLAIIALMSLVGYHSAALSEKLANEMQVNSAKKDIILIMQQSILVQRLGTRDILMGRGDESTKLLAHGQADFLHTMGELAPLLSSDEDRRLYANVQVANLNFTVRNERVLAVYRSSGEAIAIQMYKGHDGLVLSDAFSDAISDLMNAFERRRLDALSRQEASDRTSCSTMLLLAVVGLLFGSVLATVIARSIVSAVDRMLRMIEAVASNDLTVLDMQVESADEIGKASLGLNKMKNNLRDVILSIASTAQDVAGSSRDISTTASQAAGSAEEQKQQVQQVAATMEQMAATVREVSRHSNTAAQSANSAAESARDGGRVVEGVIERMRAIALSVRESAANVENLGARSDEIGRTVGVIDEIARQTSLLALNAAIEAARAGEQGRGFAVVAGEVRRLADRTSAATKQIAAVIQGLQATTTAAVQQIRSCNAGVEQGVEVTSHAGDSIQRIIREAEKAGSLVAQIAAAATQQAAATQEVTASMSQISNLAAESAGGARFSARACEQLFTLASGLQSMVDRFDLDRTGSRAARTLSNEPQASPSGSSARQRLELTHSTRQA